MAVPTKLPTRRPLRLFTVEEYEAMGEAGILHEDERIELIRGVIVQMSPMDNAHIWAVAWLQRLFTTSLGDGAWVLGQSDVRLFDSRPQPDVLLLRADAEYRVPQPEDTLLVIEVSDTTLRYDLDEKVPLYADNEVAETWVYDTKGRRVHVFRDPRDGVYATSFVERDGSVAPLAFPDLVVRINEIRSS